MIKKFMLIIMIIFIMSSLIVFGKNNIKYEVCESNIKFFLNDNEMKFDLPVFVINGYTYVSLRELVKKLNMQVIWNDKKRETDLNENMKNIQGFDIYKTFESFFEFKLSDKAEILNYNYDNNDEEHYLKVKVSISKEDIEIIKNFVKNNYEWEEIDEWESLSNINKGIYWWNLSDIDETIFAYGNFSKGRFNVNSMISICLFITQKSDDQYYLYALYI